MILWQSGSTYLQLFPHLIKGKGGTCLFAIIPCPRPSVSRLSLKTIQEGCQVLILVRLLGFNPELELSSELRPMSGVPIVLRLLGNLAKSQRGRVQKRFQPNTSCSGRHLGGIISHTSSGEGLGEQTLGEGVGISSREGGDREAVHLAFGAFCLASVLLAEREILTLSLSLLLLIRGDLNRVNLLFFPISNQPNFRPIKPAEISKLTTHSNPSEHGNDTNNSN